VCLAYELSGRFRGTCRVTDYNLFSR
jgi:hypothetical protein